MSILAPSYTANVSAYYKDMENKLHHIASVIGTDPEGATEEDIQLFRKEAYHYLATNLKPVKEPLLIVIKGGKIDSKEAA